MKNQRVYLDREQTTQMKVQMANNYIANIAPHQLMIEAINLQNRQIYQLQSRYLTLLSQTQKSQPPSDYTEPQRAKIATFQHMKLAEHQQFIQQGLKANQKKQKLLFDKEKASLQQVLANKELMHKDMKGSQINVFFNLQEGILNELVEYAVRSDHVQQVKRTQYIDEINWWKKRLEINQKDLKQSK